MKTDRKPTEKPVSFYTSFKAYYNETLQKEIPAYYAYTVNYRSFEITIYRIVKQYKCGKAEREYYVSNNGYKFGIVADLHHAYGDCDGTTLEGVCKAIKEYSINGCYIKGSESQIAHSKNVYNVFVHFGTERKLKGSITNGKFTKI